MSENEGEKVEQEREGTRRSKVSGRKVFFCSVCILPRKSRSAAARRRSFCAWLAWH